MKYNYITPVVGVPTEDQGVFVFKISSAPQTVSLFNGNRSLVTYIEVDGKEQNINTFRNYTFNTPGKHYVKYKFVDNAGVYVTAFGIDGSTKDILLEATIPGNVRTIGAFYSSPLLEKVTIMEGVKVIGGSCFWNCFQLKEANLPKESLERMEGSALDNCTSLSKVNIPKSISKIDGLTFHNCPKFDVIVIPDNITEIGNQAFADSGYVHGTHIKYLEIPSSVTTFGYQSFQGIIADNVMIHCNLPDGKSIFSNSTIYNLTLGKEVEYVGENSIKCTVIQDTFTIPETVTTISNGAFGSQYEIRVLNWYAPVELSPGRGRFGTVEEVNIGKLVPGICSGFFNGYQNLKTVNIEEGMTYIQASAFAACTIEKIKIPNSVTSLGQSAFVSCSSLKEAIISNGVTVIPTACFHDCIKLETVQIGENCTEIGLQAFKNCWKLKTINLPNTLTTIGKGAFQNCDENLTSITIPENVTSIGDSAFYDCEVLEEVICLATTPPTLGTEVFDNTHNCPIYVPADSVNTYKTAWSQYEDRIQAINS